MTEDLPEWVQWMVIGKCSPEVYDVDLMRVRGIEEDMVNALEFGLQCVVSFSDNRPTMDAIVTMIEQTCPGTCTTARSRRKKKIFS